MKRADILMASIRLRPTIGNSKWMQANQAIILKSIPSEWTPPNGVQLRLGFTLKTLGVNWVTTNDLVIAFMYLERLGLAESWSREDNAESLVVRRVPG
jgi:hypothetical protein